MFGENSPVEGQIEDRITFESEETSENLDNNISHLQESSAMQAIRNWLFVYAILLCYI